MLSQHLLLLHYCVSNQSFTFLEADITLLVLFREGYYMDLDKLTN